MPSVRRSPSTESTKPTCISSTPMASAMDCDAVALVYPRTQTFTSELRYRLLGEVTLLCLPFDVEKPKESVESSMQLLEAAARR